ncbi:16S rRNA (guanine(527)-N(7))-methyltransferase RsmG [Chromatium weissei]|nr:16S rRNA (guanine(527)-N(7))-methyltransferase RsmG [Chromatium weissei]
MKSQSKLKSKIPPIAIDQMQLAERLSAGAAQLGLTLTATQHAQLLQLVTLLAQWNQTYNLTAVRDPLAMVARHLFDSLAIAPYLGGATVLDLGTGAGLPGLPLAIIEPQRQFVLLDSNSKKIRFVRQAVMELALLNVEPVLARIETYRTTQPFTTIVSRAVADTEVIDVLRSGLLAGDGRLLLMKGRLEALPEQPIATRQRIHQLRIPFLDATRHVIEITAQCVQSLPPANAAEHK